VDGLIREILLTNYGRGKPASRKGTAREIAAVSGRDYSRALRRSFDAPQVRELILAARRMVWPQLNRQIVTIGPPEQFMRRWAGVGVNFELVDCGDDEGASLLGFYVRKFPGLRRPLIGVNVSHPQAVIGATFDHEMGHHIAAEVFGPRKIADFLTYTEFVEHLDDPMELAADLLLTLAIYPNEAQARSAGSPGLNRLASERDETNAEQALAGALEYLGKKFRLNLDEGLSRERRLRHLAAIVHYMKLRSALLDEFDI
jgi:hypothetical protein